MGLCVAAGRMPARCRAAAAVPVGVTIVMPDRVELRMPSVIPAKPTTMTSPTMALGELAEKGADVDVLPQIAVNRETGVQGISTRSVDGRGAEHLRCVQERGLSQVWRARRTRAGVAGAAHRGRLAVPLYSRCDPCQVARGRTNRERGGGSKHRRAAAGGWQAGVRQRGRAVLGRTSARPDVPRAALGQAGHQRQPRGATGRGGQGAQAIAQ